jgi:hypothetical protein
MNRALYSSKFLRQFRRNEAVTPNVATGIIDLVAGLTDTFAYWGSMTVNLAVNNINARVRLVDDDTWDRMVSNLISVPTTAYPICRIFEDTLQIRPIGVTQVDFTYLTFPAQPVFDYYIDANANIVYLTEGQAGYTLQAGEVGSAGQTAGTVVNSATIELEFSADYHQEFTNELLNRLAARGKDNLIVEHTEMKKADQEKI